MRDYDEAIWDEVREELQCLWAAHQAVGLNEGYMLLYSIPGSEPWRTQNPGVSQWVGPDDIDAAIEALRTQYNEGNLPNTPLLLNPIVHRVESDGSCTPVGSGVMWCTAFTLGVDELKTDSLARIRSLGVKAGVFHRGEGENNGLKMLAFSDQVLAPEPDGESVPGCYELYEVANVKSDAYWKYYTLSGLAYLSKNGSYQHPRFADLFKDGNVPTTTDDIKAHTVKPQTILDAAECFNAYDRHHSLFERFGVDVPNLESNLRLFNLCARDFELFDATGPMRTGGEEKFEFLVKGMIPRGAVTVLAGAGGTGKSSVAHKLCVQCAIDYEAGEETPHWLGSEVNLELAKGICVYFSGEDGPAIINARGELFDPDTRAHRLMFHRVDFGEGVSFAQFMHRLQSMPETSIVVIDPARKYLSGDEDDSEVVSEFFEAIEEFAITKNAAVIVVHHLSKGAKPKSAADILDLLRGSQVFIDRARVVLGMYRDGPYTCLGLSKCNIPPNLGMMQGERVFVRDPKTLDLVWLPGDEGLRNMEVSEEELEQIKAEAELKAAKEHVD